MFNIVDRFSAFLIGLLSKMELRAAKYRKKGYANIHDSVELGVRTTLIGPSQNFVIGPGTYINEAMLVVGKRAKIIIGERCAFGYRISIKALTHDVMSPCPDDSGSICCVEKEIRIGNFCWVGDNVYIREGVSIGNNVVIGANSVVTKSFPDNVVIGGVPAKIIRDNHKEANKENTTQYE